MASFYTIHFHRTGSSLKEVKVDPADNFTVDQALDEADMYLEEDEKVFVGSSQVSGSTAISSVVNTDGYVKLSIIRKDENNVA